MLRPYRGNNQELESQLNEFNHGFTMLNNPNIRPAIKRRIILNIEERLLAIELRTLNGDEYDQRWFAGNIKRNNNYSYNS